MSGSTASDAVLQSIQHNRWLHTHVALAFTRRQMLIIAYAIENAIGGAKAANYDEWWVLEPLRIIQIRCYRVAFAASVETGLARLKLQNCDWLCIHQVLVQYDSADPDYLTALASVDRLVKR